MKNPTKAGTSEVKTRLITLSQIIIFAVFSLACATNDADRKKDSEWVGSRTEELKKKGYKEDDARKIAQDEAREASAAAYAAVTGAAGGPGHVPTPTLDQHIGHPKPAQVAPPPPPHMEHHQF